MSKARSREIICDFWLQVYNDSERENLITVAFVFIVIYLSLLYARKDGERFAANGPEIAIAIVIFAALLIIPEIIGFANSPQPDSKGFVSEIPMLMIPVYVASIIARSLKGQKVKFIGAILVIFALLACAVILPVLLAATHAG